MLYAILCYNSEAMVTAWSKEKDDQVMAEHAVGERRLAKQGKLGPVARLMPTTTATTLRDGHDAVVIDGPFAETKEQLGGYHLVECEDLDEALAIAKRIPTLPVGGTVEVRPLVAQLK